MYYGRIEFVSICFRNATLIFRATNRWCLSFGMSLLGLLIWIIILGNQYL
jgi:hypothetical protein